MRTMGFLPHLFPKHKTKLAVMREPAATHVGPCCPENTAVRNMQMYSLAPHAVYLALLITAPFITNPLVHSPLFYHPCVFALEPSRIILVFWAEYKQHARLGNSVYRLVLSNMASQESQLSCETLPRPEIITVP